jgi:CMP-N,N'-diacetyllegionaminic acid synthase
VSPSIVALVPARSGSKRLPGKNIRLLNGVPLLAYAIATAHESGIFGAVAVSSDDPDTLEIAERYGASHLILRPDEYAQDDSPDIQWVRHALEAVGGDFDHFAILRPTSPFRRGLWVADAYAAFTDRWAQANSLRAMRPVSEHAAKMWRVCGDVAYPLLPFEAMGVAPWHSSPTQSLPELYVQTAALEIAQTDVVRRGSISGSVIMPWVTTADAPEAIDVNTIEDWRRAEQYAVWFPEALPQVEEVRV